MFSLFYPLTRTFVGFPGVPLMALYQLYTLLQFDCEMTNIPSIKANSTEHTGVFNMQ